MLADPESVYEETDKIKQLVTSESLPPDLRMGVANIIMKEGNRSPVELFALIRGELAGDEELMPLEAVKKVRSETATSEEYKEDGIARREAALILMKESFPQLEQQSSLVEDYMEANSEIEEFGFDGDLSRIDRTLDILRGNEVDVAGIEEAVEQYKAWDEGEKPADLREAIIAKMSAEDGIKNSAGDAIAQLPERLVGK